MAADYRFGIEEEFFLADAETGASPKAGAADRFHAAARAVEAASHEFLKGQVEIQTGPDTDLDAARADLRRMRQALASIADAEGLLLFAAGTHPLGRPRDQHTTDSRRYDRLKAELGIIAPRAIVCAMHIHVEVPDPSRRIDILNRLMPFLPLLLALSIGSPFWAGRASRLHGFRLAVFSEWPRMGLPEIFTDDAHYERYVAGLVAAGFVADASYVWWLVRPSKHYPTIELRICDSCARVDDVVAIAALCRCLVRAIVRRPDIHASVGSVERGLTAENVWQVQRLGVHAVLAEAVSGGTMSIRDHLEGTLGLVAEDAAALGCADWVERTRAIIERGSSADRQLAGFKDAREAGRSRRKALHDVVRLLADETRA